MKLLNFNIKLQLCTRIEERLLRLISYAYTITYKSEYSAIHYPKL